MSCLLKGKIKAFDGVTGASLGKWGGTECMLSIESDLGPVLIVKAASQPVQKGTFYELEKITGVVGLKGSGEEYKLPDGVRNGVLSINVKRLKRDVNLQIKVGPEQVPVLKEFASHIAKGFTKLVKWSRLPLELDAGKGKRKQLETEATSRARRERLAGTLEAEPDTADPEADPTPKRRKTNLIITEKNLELNEQSHTLDAPNKKDLLNDWVLNNIVLA
eukprot:TRINITY_DN42161_c0_g1_i1.p1 TRINITY_DN42161_c0_g1~~TRINITY_DN42161_c0_g1_i1.p1  ORF type:complete len:219 (+),score=41.43 TRINITY_DN42161_c0_g1_i1:40-696(+)